MDYTVTEFDKRNGNLAVARNPFRVDVFAFLAKILDDYEFSLSAPRGLTRNAR